MKAVCALVSPSAAFVGMLCHAKASMCVYVFIFLFKLQFLFQVLIHLRVANFVIVLELQMQSLDRTLCDLGSMLKHSWFVFK